MPPLPTPLSSSNLAVPFSPPPSSPSPASCSPQHLGLPDPIIPSTSSTQASALTTGTQNNWSKCDCIITPGDKDIHLLQAQCPHALLQWGDNPSFHPLISVVSLLICVLLTHILYIWLWTWTCERSVVADLDV